MISFNEIEFSLSWNKVHQSYCICAPRWNWVHHSYCARDPNWPFLWPRFFSSAFSVLALLHFLLLLPVWMVLSRSIPPPFSAVDAVSYSLTRQQWLPFAKMSGPMSIQSGVMSTTELPYTSVADSLLFLDTAVYRYTAKRVLFILRRWHFDPKLLAKKIQPLE